MLSKTKGLQNHVGLVVRFKFQVKVPRTVNKLTPSLYNFLNCYELSDNSVIKLRYEVTVRPEIEKIMGWLAVADVGLHRSIHCSELLKKSTLFQEDKKVTRFLIIYVL